MTLENNRRANHAPAGTRCPAGDTVCGRRAIEIGAAACCLRQKPPRPMLHTGTISGLLLGNFAIVASLTFRCWATSAGGVWVIQSDSENIHELRSSEHFEDLQFGVAGVLDIVSEILLDVADVARVG